MVVVADRGALPEVVGDGGIVTEPTPGALAAAIDVALDAGRNAAGHGGP